MIKQLYLDVQGIFLKLIETAKTEEERDFFDGLAFYIEENFIKEKIK